MVFSPFFLMIKYQIKSKNKSNNLRFQLETEKNEYYFLQIIENYLSTSNIFFQDLLGNKPWLFPQPNSLKTLDLQGFWRLHEPEI